MDPRRGGRARLLDEGSDQQQDQAARYARSAHEADAEGERSVRSVPAHCILAATLGAHGTVAVSVEPHAYADGRDGHDDEQYPRYTERGHIAISAMHSSEQYRVCGGANCVPQHTHFRGRVNHAKSRSIGSMTPILLVAPIGTIERTLLRLFGVP